tara:strand:- start:2970 stop:4523 length:1554 start_codon:yes stop_codon:yes gene_type:complete
MSRLRSDKLVNKAATGAPELTYGASIPVTGTINGAGGVNITGVATASKFVGDGSGLFGVVASGTGVVVYEDGSLVGTAGTFNFGTNISVSPPSAGVATITSVNTDTNTTYGVLTVLDGSNVRLRLAGSDSSEDDTIITAGTNIAFTGVSASGFSIESTLSGLANVVEDTTPQLGGNLDLNGKVIEGTGSINMTGGVSATIFTGAFNGPSNGLTGTPDITVRNIVGAGATFSGDVSIGGTLTYEDVTNVDTLGISTFNDDTYFVGSQGTGVWKGMYWDKSLSALQFDRSQKIYLGPTASSGAWTGAGSTTPGPGAGLELHGDQDYGYIEATNSLYIRGGNFGSADKIISIEAQTNKKNIEATGAGGTKLFHNNNQRLETVHEGVVISGVCTASEFVGSISTPTLTVGSSVGIGTSGGVFTAVAGTPTTIDSFTVASTNYKTAEYTVHMMNGNNEQAQKILVMQDGSNAYYQEYAIMSAPNKIASFDALLVTGDCTLRATPESGISGVTTFSVVRQTIL